MGIFSSLSGYTCVDAEVCKYMDAPLSCTPIETPLPLTREAPLPRASEAPLPLISEAPLPLVIFDEDTFVEKDFPISLPMRSTYLSSSLRLWLMRTNSWADR
jgi:hypothetical protein